MEIESVLFVSFSPLLLFFYPTVTFSPLPFSLFFFISFHLNFPLSSCLKSFPLPSNFLSFLLSSSVIFFFLLAFPILFPLPFASLLSSHFLSFPFLTLLFFLPLLTFSFFLFLPFISSLFLSFSLFSFPFHHLCYCFFAVQSYVCSPLT